MFVFHHSSFIIHSPTPLTVLPNIAGQTPAELVRLFHQAQLEWSRHLGEETQLDFGRWISNPALATSDVANCLHDAYLLPDLSGVQLIDQMEEMSQKAGTLWRGCSMNPSAAPAQGAALVEALLRSGWTARPLIILQRRSIPPLGTQPDLNLTILPTRASYRHFRQLLEQRPTETEKRYPVPFSSASANASADLLHLDDSHLDSLLALRDGQPVGCISVLTSGEVATIRQWYVPEQYRNQQIGRLLLIRSLEICARAQLRHVMIGLPPAVAPPAHLAAQAGFEPIGQWINYARPLQC